MIRIISSFFLMLFFLLGANISNAAPPAVPAPTSVSAPLNSVNQSLDLAVKDTTVKLQNIAVKWLSAFILLQFFITNFVALKSGGEIDSVFYKFIGSIAWFSICFIIMDNGAQFLSDVSGGFFTTAAEIAGGGGNFDTADILDKGAYTANSLITNVTNAASFVSLIPAVVIAGLLSIVIMGVAAVIAFKLFIIKIEVMLLVMMAPLSFAFLGLNTMKDQGIAPFKSLISLMYRIILLAVIMSAMDSVGKNLHTVIASVDSTSFVSGMWQSLFGAVVAFALLGYLAYKSDAMAANLSSGSTSLGTSDVASSAALGAAVGAAIATGGVASAGAAASGGKSMSDVMKSMMGGSGGGASDASGGRGAGGSGPVGQPPAKPANMSTSGAWGSSSGGAPRLPETDGVSSGPSPAEIAAVGSTGAGNTAPANSAAGGGAPMQSESGSGAGGSSSGGAPVQDTAKPNGSSPAETAAGGGNAGSGATAGIGGTGSTLEANLGKLVDQMSQQNAPKKPGLKDHLSNVNQQAIHERANVSVSINPNVE